MALIEYKAPFWCRPHSSSGELSSVQEASLLNILLYKGIVFTLIIIRVGLETYNHDAETVVTVQNAEMKQSSTLDWTRFSALSRQGLQQNCLQLLMTLRKHLPVYQSIVPSTIEPDSHRHGHKFILLQTCTVTFQKSWTQHAKPVI